MTNQELFHEDHRATYSPEDNKLRLYVGRVPKEQYLALRAEGWTTTPKQNCDFVATWTPRRRDTAMSYAGIIEDEDMGPDERAADRAERFGGYLQKRLTEATGHAANYEAGPQAHGFQSQERAERAAQRHDRIADRACDAWSKAEYWQRRTAGVIAHALYVSSPSVRMGRIKTIEADLRRENLCPQWREHLTLRLAYENQMLEAQGGRLAHVEILPGGTIGGKLIVKVNKSPVTGRVTSVDLKGPQVHGWTYRAHNVPGTDYALYSFDTERLAPDAYIPPTDETLAELAGLKDEKKAIAKKAKEGKTSCPLVNPTDEDAERLQALWNEHARLYFEKRSKESAGWSLNDFKPQSIIRTTQANYSAQSKGTYCAAGTRAVFAGGIECANFYRAAEKMRAKHGDPVCKVRRSSGGAYQASRVIVLTDKPQKRLPNSVWETAPVSESVTA